MFPAIYLLELLGAVILGAFSAVATVVSSAFLALIPGRSLRFLLYVLCVFPFAALVPFFFCIAIIDSDPLPADKRLCVVWTIVMTLTWIAAGILFSFVIRRTFKDRFQAITTHLTRRSS